MVVRPYIGNNLPHHLVKIIKGIGLFSQGLKGFF
jgi:hypothetical protein